MASSARAPLPVRAAVLIMLLVAVGYVITAVALFVGHHSANAVVTASWLAFFAITNVVLAVFIRRGRGWARTMVLILYTLSAVRDATLLFEGAGSGSKAISLLIAAAVIVSLAGPAGSHQYFANTVDADTTQST